MQMDDPTVELVVYRHGDRWVDANGNEVDPADVQEETAPQDYSKMTNEALSSEIDRRNSTRADEEKIVPESTKKADMAAALEQDDEDNEDEE